MRVLFSCIYLVVLLIVAGMTDIGHVFLIMLAFGSIWALTRLDELDDIGIVQDLKETPTHTFRGGVSAIGKSIVLITLTILVSHIDLVKRVNLK